MSSTSRWTDGPRVMRAFELGYEARRTPLELDRALAAANAGTPVVLERALAEVGFLDVVTEMYLEEIGALTTPTIAQELRTKGLQRLHDVLAPEQVVAMIALLDDRARDLSVPIARAFVRSTSSARPHYFICARTWIRALVPYREVAGDAAILALGHMNGHLLPVDPHRDFSLSHPRGSVVFWSAVGPVSEGNTIALFEGCKSEPGRAITPSLAAGDVLMFNADTLHASVRNETDETRISIGNRVKLGWRLSFGPGTHWRPWHDASMVDTPLRAFATLQSRATPAALRRWSWRRQWTGSQREGQTASRV